MLYGKNAASLNVREENNFISALLLNRNIPEKYPASLSQARLWFLDQLQNMSAAYNVHVGLWLKGPLDVEALTAALTAIVNRHDSFRTTFHFEDGKVIQAIAAQSPSTLQMSDLSESDDPVSRAYEVASEEVQVAFDLASGPLFRARLIRVFREDHVFLCTMHHIVTDSWSMQLFVKELIALYTSFSNGQGSPLPELPVCYGDYAEWQRECFESGALRDQIEYWREKLRGAPRVLALPTDAPRPPEQTFCGSSQTALLSETVVANVRELARSYHCTPFMVLLAAFKALLYRYSGQEDVLVGVPVAGRNRVETEGLMGFFVNTLVLRDQVAGDSRFVDILANVRETTISAFANAEVPFEKIVEVLQPERSLSYNPVFQVMFSSIKAAVQTHTFGNLVAYPYVVNTNNSIFDLSATLVEATDGQWCMQFEYNTDLFSHERIGRMLADYSALLEAITENPNIPVSRVPLSAADAIRLAPRSDFEPKAESGSGQVEVTARVGQNAACEHNCELLLNVWRTVLGVEKIGIHDNFFEIGGHSLLATRLIREIEKATGQDIRVSAIFRAPTISSLASLISDVGATSPDPIAMEICRGTGLHSLFAVAIPGVDTFGFGTLAHHIEGKHSVYRLQAATPVILDRPFSAEELDALAQRYIAAMRSVQPEGPYCLAAMCDGVRLAQAIVLALERERTKVSLFTVFDTWVLENSMVRPLWALDYFRQRLQRFMDVSWHERWNIAQRSLERLFNKKQERRRSGWKQAYWPGENFRPPRFQAPILLFKRPQQPFYYVRDPEMGWGARTTGGVEICEVACGHVEMLREPHIRVVAEKVSSRLSMAGSYTALTIASAPEALVAEVGEWLDHSAA